MGGVGGAWPFSVVPVVPVPLLQPGGAGGPRFEARSSLELLFLRALSSRLGRGWPASLIMAG